MEKSIDRFREIQSVYQPGPEAIAVLENTNCVSLIGPAATGKSTLLDAVVESEADFGNAIGFTTRPQRPNEADDAYNFLPHNEQTLSYLLEQVKQQRLVQFAVHPTTGYIYGTEAKSYQYPYSLMVMLSSAADDFSKLPFKSVQEICIVCEPEQWQKRVVGRMDDQADVMKRVDEAKLSLNWSLARGDQLIWLDNSSPDIDQTASDLAEVIRGNLQPDSANREVGQRLLDHLETIG